MDHKAFTWRLHLVKRSKGRLIYPHTHTHTYPSRCGDSVLCQDERSICWSEQAAGKRKDGNYRTGNYALGGISKRSRDMMLPAGARVGVSKEGRLDTNLKRHVAENWFVYEKRSVFKVLMHSCYKVGLACP